MIYAYFGITCYCIKQQARPIVSLCWGGYDDRAAVYAAELTKQFHYWDVMICNGVANDSLLAASRTGATETEHALAAMQRTGFTKQAIPETKAQNIKEGVKLSFDLLRSQNKPMPLTSRSL